MGVGVVVHGVYTHLSILQIDFFQPEYFPIGSNVNLCPAVAAILDFRPA